VGGPGSGWRCRYGTKRTVEGCHILDINKLVRIGVIRTMPWQGTIVWSDTNTGEQTARVGYTCTSDGGGWTLTLSYTVTRSNSEKHDVLLRIPLQTTDPQFGGVRWWFTCPLVVRGLPCERRVGKLYLPPGGLYFGCRHCYDLTYTSCHESHKYDGLWRTIAAETGYAPNMVKRIIEGRF